WAARDAHPPPVVATAVTLAAAAALIAVTVLVTRPAAARTLGPAVVGFAPAGLILGAAYACLLVAFDHGRVSIVAPLNATQSLWAVVFAAAVIGTKHEAIGVRLVLAGAFVVAGSAL